MPSKITSGSECGIHRKLINRASGRKIVAILEKNPKKDSKKYEQDDIQHMRKVVSYCKRHLAQEGKAKQDPQSKSAKSLKNWVRTLMLLLERLLLLT